MVHFAQTDEVVFNNVFNNVCLQALTDDDNWHVSPYGQPHIVQPHIVYALPPLFEMVPATILI